MRLVASVLVGGIVIGAAGLLAPAQDAHIILDGSAYDGSVDTRTRFRVQRSGYQWPQDLARSDQVVNSVIRGGFGADVSFSQGMVTFAGGALGSFTSPTTPKPSQNRFHTFTVAPGVYLEAGEMMVEASTTSEAIADGTVVLTSIDGVGFARGDWDLDTVFFRHRFRFVGEVPYALLPRDSQLGRTRRFKGTTSISGRLFYED